MVLVILSSCHDGLRCFLPQGRRGEHRGQQISRHGGSRFTRNPETHLCRGRFHRGTGGITRWVLQYQDHASYGADCIATRTILLSLMLFDLAVTVSVCFAQRAMYPCQECFPRFVHTGHASGSPGRRLSCFPPLIAPTPGIVMQAGAGFAKR